MNQIGRSGIVWRSWCHGFCACCDGQINAGDPTFAVDTVIRVFQICATCLRKSMVAMDTINGYDPAFTQTTKETNHGQGNTEI